MDENDDAKQRVEEVREDDVLSLCSTSGPFDLSGTSETCEDCVPRLEECDACYLNRQWRECLFDGPQPDWAMMKKPILRRR